MGCVHTHIIYFNHSIILDTLSPKLCPVSQLSKQGGDGGLGIGQGARSEAPLSPPAHSYNDRILSLSSNEMLEISYSHDKCAFYKIIDLTVYNFRLLFLNSFQFSVSKLRFLGTRVWH